MSLPPELGCALPLIPKAILRAHRVYEQYDTRFRAAARLLQALWRQEQELPIGGRVGRDGSKRRLGSMLSQVAAVAGRNFMTPAVAAWTRGQLIYRQPGALFDEQRVLANLLASTPLTANLFAPLALDLLLAATVLRRLMPDLSLVRVDHIVLEFSPGRREPALTNDRTAFDVGIFYTRRDSRSGFVGIEAKYSEAMYDSSPVGDAEHLVQLARSSAMFKNPAHGVLRANPFSQLFREHLLAYASLARGDFAAVDFLLIAPRYNHAVQSAAVGYASHLTDAQAVPFKSIDLEEIIAAIGLAGQLDYATALHGRYCDWSKLDSAIASALAATGSASWTAILPSMPAAIPRLPRAA